ncbi:TetR family transcriptional regulator [Lentibacillus kapialis]|uniref:TetR family transcriptional regulator n=1 Tax=Lentibacillus kapialis TaxID=340214 RepID=A0A917PTT6_9BACI|nr:TetR/AcrR family transcriptional regulator [Lentibacillus kapialis]GGJ91498.1 TetR family transcriptional regulator [Lentibacillus kapialis]
MSDMMDTLRNEKNMTPKQIDILRAAVELIAEKGYYNTSTSEIADRAGVAEGTIFRHYRTKKDLLVAIVTPVISNFSAPLFAEQFVAQVFREAYATFKELLYAFIKNRFEFAQSNVPLIRILLQELAFHPEIQTVYKQQFSEKVYPALNQAIDFYKQKGELKDMPNETIIRTIVSTILGFMMTRFMLKPDQNWDDEAEIKQTIDIMMDGLGKV